MGRREINVEIFRDTAEMIRDSEQLKKVIALTQQRQQMIPAGAAIAAPAKVYDRDAEVIVSGRSTLEAAGRYKGKKVCILNFASATNPGGGVKNGSSAQEESLCRASTLYFCLDTPQLMHDFYQPHRRAGNPMYNDDMIYSPDVWVIKTTESFPDRLDKEDCYPLDVITCAAPNLRRYQEEIKGSQGEHIKTHMMLEGLEDLLESRIRRIFAAAAAAGNEVLILGAFGCGAFRNPPELVSYVFRQVTEEYRRNFETIEYAVFCKGEESRNFRVFQAAFQA